MKNCTSYEQLLLKPYLVQAIDRELATRSLSEFVRLAWPVLEPATPFVPGWHIDAIVEHLEAVTRGHLTRTLAAFEWDLNANVAMLQITQLQRDGDYEEVAGQFFQLVSPWLDIKQFGFVDLRQVIRSLHEIEGKGQAEARSHGVHYRSPRGRRVSAHSPTPRDSVVGENFIDDAMDSVRKNGVGHLGNFYWLAGNKPGPVTNTLKDDVHVIIVGAKSRVNFPTPNTEVCSSSIWGWSGEQIRRAVPHFRAKGRETFSRGIRAPPRLGALRAGARPAITACPSRSWTVNPSSRTPCQHQAPGCTDPCLADAERRRQGIRFTRIRRATRQQSPSATILGTRA